MMVHRQVEGRCALPGQAQQAVAVGAVVRNLKFHDGVIVADDLVDILPRGAGFIVQNPDAVGKDAGQIVLG